MKLKIKFNKNNLQSNSLFYLNFQKYNRLKNSCRRYQMKRIIFNSWICSYVIKIIQNYCDCLHFVTLCNRFFQVLFVLIYYYTLEFNIEYYNISFTFKYLQKKSHLKSIISSSSSSVVQQNFRKLKITCRYAYTVFTKIYNLIQEMIKKGERFIFYIRG